jgi:hypothetical protein
MNMPTFDQETFLVIGLGGMLGFVGGVARHFFSKEQLSKTILFGMIAALGTMAVAHPTDWVQVIGGSLVAGFASDAVLASFISREKLENAKRDAERNKLEAKDAGAKHDAAEIDLGKALGALKSLLGAGGGLQVSSVTPPSGPSPSLVAELEAAQAKRTVR